ncbi:hypothetical protein N9T17_04310, partial [Candidatus Pelagibacter sp.]|nr:hypothetical protein [Candidatus Pelagibacter sp.]
MFKKIFALLEKDQKRKIFFYQLLFIFQGILEAVGVISVIPLIYAVSSKDKEILLSKINFLEKYLIKFELQEIQFLFIFVFLIYYLILNLILSINFVISEKLSKDFYNRL